MKHVLAIGAMIAFALTATVAANAADDEKPKYTIKQVMEKAHKGNDALLKKVAGGSAGADEKKTLLEMYVALGKNKAPKGDADSWNEKTTAIVTAAKAVAEDKEGGIAALKKATNCGACHKAHKPS